MTKLLAKLFVKDHENLNSEKVRTAYGTMSGIVGIVVNAMLSALKLLLGIISGSLSIMADALNNLSDAGASMITLVSFKMASKPADKEHPFGHARIEYIASMIVAFLILLVGFEMISDSIGTIFGEAKIGVITTVTIIMLSVSIAVKLWLAFFYFSVAKRINSGTVKASGQDSLFDAISTTGVLATTVIIKLTGFAMLDAIIGVCISILIIVAGARILNETKNVLLGEAPVKETVEGIKAIVSEYPEILGIHDLMVHNYGPNRLIASFHAEVDGHGDFFAIHDTIDNLEKHIGNEMKIPCTVHLDPILVGDKICDKLKEIAKKAAAEAYEGLSIHDFRCVVGATHTNLIFDIVVPFDATVSPNEIVERIKYNVSVENPNYYCVITVDRS